MNLIFYAVLAIIVTTISWKGGYFALPGKRVATVALSQLILIFALFIGISIFAPPLLISYLRHLPLERPVMMGLAHLLTNGLGIGALAIYISFQPLKGVWKQSEDSYLKDIGMGLLALVVCVPVVSFVNQFSDQLTEWIFKREGEEQVAVQFLKTAASHPFVMVVALVTIVGLAPLLEEFLFRGVLQTYLIPRLGIKASIVATSACFALFHYSATQGIGNFSLVLSLFVFSLYLGHLYERQRSLLAPIILHMTFNSISVIRILILETGS